LKSALKILKEEFVIHRLGPEEPIPKAVLDSKFFWIAKTHEELSMVCESKILPHKGEVSKGWSCIKVDVKLDFELTGIIAGLSSVLAKAAVSIFALSTFDTDYILVKSEQIEKAAEVLKNSGFDIQKAR